MVTPASVPTLASARQLLDDSKYRRACVAFEQIAQRKEDAAAANVGWADALLKLGNHEEAALRYAAAFEADPTFPGALDSVSGGRLRIDNRESLIDRLQAFVDGIIDPEAHRAWASFLSADGKYDQALREFEKAAAAPVLGPAAYEAWGQTLAKLSRHREALEKYAEAILADTTATEADAPFDLAAESIQALPDPTEGIALFAKMAAQTDRRIIRLRWARTLYELPRADLGAVAYRELIEGDPKEVLARSSWVAALLSVQDADAAAAEIARAVDLFPSDETSYSHLPDVLFAVKDSRPLIDRLASRVAKEAAQGPHALLGVAFFRANLADAVNQFENAAKFGPVDEDTFYSWVYALVGNGDHAGAIALLIERINFNPAKSSEYVSRLGYELHEIRKPALTPTQSVPKRGGTSAPASDPFSKALHRVQATIDQCDSEETHVNWIRALIDLDLLSAAIDHGYRSAKRFPASASLYVVLGDALAAARKPDEAIAKYAVAVEQHGTSAALRPNVREALMAIASENRRASIELMQHAVDRVRSSDTYLWWGHVLSRLSEVGAAAEQFEAGISLDRDNPRLLTNLAEALATQQQCSRAVARCVQAIKAGSGEVESVHDALMAFDKAVVALHRDDLAVQALQEAFDEIDGFYAYRSWALTLGGGRHAGAELEQFTKALAKFPASAGTRAEYADRLARAGRKDEALAEYQVAAERDPFSAFVHRTWGGTLLGLRRYEDAIDKYVAAYELSPDDPGLLFDWALALEGIQSYADADAKYRDCIRLEDKVITAYAMHNLAFNEERRGDYDAAGRRWEDALVSYAEGASAARDSRRAEFFVYQASVFFEVKRDFAGAEKNLDIALELSPNNVPALAALCNLLVARQEDSSIDPKHADVAAQYCARAREVRARAARLLERQISELATAESYAGLGHLLLGASEYEPAKKALLKTLELDPDDHSAYYLLARANLGNGEYKDAIRNLKDALRREPQNQSYRSKLAEAYFKSGSLEAAELEYQGVLAMAPRHLDSLIGLAGVYIGLGEASQKIDKTSDAEGYFQRALDQLTDAAEKKTPATAYVAPSNTPRMSRPITPVERAAMEYSRGYARVRLYEAQSLADRDERLLHKAADAFRGIPRNDANYYKAQRALMGIKARVQGPAADAVKWAERSIAVGAFALFLAANIAFWWGKPRFTETVRLTDLSVQTMREARLPEQVINRVAPLANGDPVPANVQGAALKLVLGDTLMSRYGEAIMQTSIPGSAITTREPIDAGPYALLAFGSLVFMVVGFYMQQLSKLSFGGIALEKTSTIAPRDTASLGVSAPSGASIKP